MLTTLQKWLLGVFVVLPATVGFVPVSLLGFHVGLAGLMSFIGSSFGSLRADPIGRYAGMLLLLPGLGGLCGVTALWLLLLTPHAALQGHSARSKGIFRLLCVALIGVCTLVSWGLPHALTQIKGHDDWFWAAAFFVVPALLVFFGFYVLHRQSGFFKKKS
jgi:hypothetical protein